MFVGEKYLELSKHWKKLLGQDYTAIQFEEMVQNPHQTAKDICTFLGIESLAPENPTGEDLAKLSEKHVGVWKRYSDYFPDGNP